MKLIRAYRRTLRSIARHFSSDERAQSVIEFAISLPFLAAMSIGTFAVGMIVDRHLTLGQLVRNAGNMFARGIVFTDSFPNNQKFLVDSGSGLGMTTNGGNGVIYFSLLTRVDPDADCGSGPGSCANAGKVIVIQRYTVGNASLTGGGTSLTSRFDGGGAPSPLDTLGNVDDFFNNTTAEVSIPADLTTALAGLQADELIYAVEAYHIPTSIAFPGIFAPDYMYSRAFF